MGSRHALVIGSQCNALPNQRLSFLPDRARELFEVLTDPLRGGCEAAPTSVFLTDPTMEELRQAVSTAVAQASAAGATLVFAFIGHAVTAPSRHSQPLFLLPADGNPSTPGSETAYEIGHRLGEMDMAGLDGLIVILDACHAGAGVRDVIKSGLDLEQQVRLELLAGTFLRKARNGCFSQALIRLMEHGAPGLSADYLEIRHAANVAADYCRTVQQPPVYIGSGFGQNASDPGLWVSRNVASPGKWLLSGTDEGALAVALTQSFQPTNDLERVTAAMSGQRLVVLQGGAGSGKSALIAALARPELVPDLPARYLAAVAFTVLAPTLTGLAKTLARQLARFEGFSAAAADYEGRLTAQELNRRPALERLVFGPLRTLRVPLGRRIRLAIDGIDELESSSRAELLSAVTGFSAEEPPSRVSVLLSTRGEDQSQDLRTAQVNLSRPGADEITEYLQNLELPESLAVDLQAHADTWLQLRLLADLAVSVPAQSLRTVAGLDDLYQELLAPLAVNDNPEARIVVAVLSAAGSGPVLPLRVAVGACAALGGPADLTQFRDIVATLGGIVARAHPGTPEERLGLFHDTLVRHIHALTDWPISVRDAHASILETLGSTDGQGARNYARDRAPEHLWALDRHEQALEAVVSCLGHRAADNRDLLQAWSDRAATVFSPDNITWLALQRHLLYWTGRAGDTAGAIAGFREVLDARLRVLGPDHPDTLNARRQLVYWTGRAGDTTGDHRAP